MSLRAGRDLREGTGSVKLSALFLSLDNLVNILYIGKPRIEGDSIIMSNKKEPLVILMSGGLDSLIAYYYAQSLNKIDDEPTWSNIVALHVDIGQPYAEKEREALSHFPFPVETVTAPFITSANYAYPRPTPEAQIIPGRNMTLCAIAANYGTTIWMCALKGEMSAYMVDKNDTFFKLASATLSYTFGTPISIETPFKRYTKSDVVRLAINTLHIPLDILKATSSCYDAVERNCGVCGTCVKRALAFANNGIEEEYEHDPFESPYLYDLITNKFVNGSKADYDDERKVYTHNSLVKIGRPGVLNTKKILSKDIDFEQALATYGWNPYYFKQQGK